MNKLVFLSFLILVLYIITTCNGISDQNKNKRRKNEDECSLRRCCSTRKKFRNKMNNDNIINCKSLTDRECGKYDEFCEWNCNGAGNGDDNDSPFIKKYHGISSFGGSYQEPSYDKKKNDDNNKNKNKKQEFESYDDYVKDSKFISIDDCGVMYEVEIPSDIINEKWKNQEMKGIAAGEKPLRNDQDLPRRLKILGPDGRWETTSRDYPYSTVLYIEFDTPQGTFRCTATMISKRWALTAAHCVWGNSDWYSNFKLFSHIDDCNELGSSAYFSWSEVVMLSAYENEQIFDYDMAMIKIDSSNSGLGYLSFSYDLGMTYEYMNMISHPGDKGCDKMVQNNCPWNKFNDNTFETKECDATGGASGSAVYKNGITYITYGVLVGAVGFPNNPADDYNVASRITPGRYNSFCTEIEQDEPGRCGQFYNIKNYKGKCLDIHRADFDSNINGAKVHLWDCGSGPANQLWYYNQNTKQIISKNNKCLDIHKPDYDSNKNGAKVHLWDCGSGAINDNQKWYYDINTQQLKNHKGKCLDVHKPDYDSNINGAKVHIWDCGDGAINDNQKWNMNQHISGLLVPPAPASWFKPYQTGRSWQLFVEGGSSKSYEFFLIGIGMLILLNIVCFTKYYWNNNKNNNKVKYNPVSMDTDSDQI